MDLAFHSEVGVLKDLSISLAIDILPQVVMINVFETALFLVVICFASSITRFH